MRRKIINIKDNNMTKLLTTKEILQALVAGHTIAYSTWDHGETTSIDNINFTKYNFTTDKDGYNYWYIVEPPEKVMMTDEEIFAFVFKHRSVILFKEGTFNNLFILNSLDMSDTRFIKIADDWVSYNRLRDEWMYTLDTDIKTMQFHNWEK